MNSCPIGLNTAGSADDRLRIWRRRFFRTGWIVLLFIGCTFLFYAEENYRGEQAWQRLKRGLIAQGQQLDPDALDLPPVPDAENFLKAPLIKDWFAVCSLAPGISPPEGCIRITRAGDENLLGSWSEFRPTDLKEWRDYFRRSESKPAQTRRIDSQTGAGQDEVDQRQSELTSLAQSAPSEFECSVPLIVIDDVPLRDALQNLARQAKVGILFDPSAFNLAKGGKPLMESPVSIRFEGVSVLEALEVVVEHHGLVLAQTTTTGLLRITRALAPAPVWPDEAVDLTTLALPVTADLPLPVVIMDEVPSLEAVRRAARQVGINFQFDPQVTRQTSAASCSLELKDVSPREVLRRVLRETGLALKSHEGSSAFSVVPWHSVMPLPRGNSAEEVLGSFSRFDEEFCALHSACERPRSRMDVDWRRWISEGPFSLNFTGYRQVAQALALHASAELSLSNSPVAFQDATALYRMVGTLSGQPNLVCTMTEVSLAGQYLQVVWEGLAGSRWDDAQLALIEQQLASIDLLKDCFIGLEGNQAAKIGWLAETPSAELAGEFVERTTGYKLLGRSVPLWAEPVRWAIRWGPRGWIRQLQIGYTQAFQDHFNQLDVHYQRVFPSNQLTSSAQGKVPIALLPSISVLVQRYGFNFVKVVETTARQQTGINQARIACGLERYRAAFGELPYELAQLAPRMRERLPHDLVTGHPLHYRRIGQGQFVLYSVGWDGKDDAAGWADWVWRYPRKKHNTGVVSESVMSARVDSGGGAGAVNHAP